MLSCMALPSAREYYNQNIKKSYYNSAKNIPKRMAKNKPFSSLCNHLVINNLHCYLAKHAYLDFKRALIRAQKGTFYKLIGHLLAAKRPYIGSKGTKKIVKYQSKRVYKWTRERGIYIKSTSFKTKGHEWKANSCPLFIPLLIIFTERRAREDNNTKLCFSAITLKYLSQHITCKLAFSLTHQLKLTLLFLCLSPQANR